VDGESLLKTRDKGVFIQPQQHHQENKEPSTCIPRTASLRPSPKRSWNLYNNKAPVGYPEVLNYKWNIRCPSNGALSYDLASTWYECVCECVFVFVGPVGYLRPSRRKQRWTWTSSIRIYFSSSAVSGPPIRMTSSSSCREYWLEASLTRPRLLFFWIWIIGTF